jgi:GTPase KRas protein
MKSSYQICLFGDAGVGKSSLLVRICSNRFVEEYDPCCEDFQKQVTIDGEPCLIQFIEAYDEELPAFRDNWIRDSDGFLIVYSIASRSSFERVNSFMEVLRMVKDKNYMEVVVVGNKCDVDTQREVSTVEGERAVGAMGAMFLEASAKTGENVERAFADVIRSIRRQEDLASTPRGKSSSSSCSLM